MKKVSKSVRKREEKLKKMQSRHIPVDVEQVQKHLYELANNNKTRIHSVNPREADSLWLAVKMELDHMNPRPLYTVQVIRNKLMLDLSGELPVNKGEGTAYEVALYKPKRKPNKYVDKQHGQPKGGKKE